MNSAEDIEHAIERLHVTTRARTDERILEDAFAALEESGHKQPSHVTSGWHVVSMSRLIKLGAVAAVFLVALALFFRGPAVKAVTLAQIYEAVEKVRNVCISSFGAGKQEPIQKEWVSRTLNIIMFETKEEFVLHDLRNKVIQIKSLSSGTIKTVVPTEEVFARAKKRMARAIGLVPFSEFKDIPETARWNRVYDPNVVIVDPDTQVYDLIWTTPESTIPPGLRTHTWRYFIDTRTNLPTRVEVYSKGASEANRTLHKYDVPTYMTDTEVRALIQNTFGSRDDETSKKGPSEPEPILSPAPE